MLFPCTNRKDWVGPDFRRYLEQYTMCIRQLWFQNSDNILTTVPASITETLKSTVHSTEQTTNCRHWWDCGQNWKFREKQKKLQPI